MTAMRTAAQFVAIILIATCAHLAGAAGQNDSKNSGGTWRCGNSYSDQPCTGGRAVDVQDPRSAADQRAEQRAQDARTRDTQRQADAMARERRSLEAQAARQRPAVIAPPPAHPAPPPPARESTAKRPKTHKPKKRAQGESEAFSASKPAEPAASEKKKKQEDQGLSARNPRGTGSLTRPQTARPGPIDQSATPGGA